MQRSNYFYFRLQIRTLTSQDYAIETGRVARALLSGPYRLSKTAFRLCSRDLYQNKWACQSDILSLGKDDVSVGPSENCRISLNRMVHQISQGFFYQHLRKYSLFGKSGK